MPQCGVAPILFGLAVVFGAVGVMIAGGIFNVPSLGQVLVGVSLLIAGYLLGLAGWRIEKRRQDKWPN